MDNAAIVGCVELESSNHSGACACRLAVEHALRCLQSARYSTEVQRETLKFVVRKSGTVMHEFVIGAKAKNYKQTELIPDPSPRES